MDVVMALCERIFVMNFGEKLAEGTRGGDPADPDVLKAYLGEGFKRASASNLNVKYGHIHALHDLSLEVEQGPVVAVVGANGAGKTTLLATLAGLLGPSSGEILFEGEPLPREPSRWWPGRRAWCPSGAGCTPT